MIRAGAAGVGLASVFVVDTGIHAQDVRDRGPRMAEGGKGGGLESTRGMRTSCIQTAHGGQQHFISAPAGARVEGASFFPSVLGQPDAGSRQAAPWLRQHRP